MAGGITAPQIPLVSRLRQTSITLPPLSKLTLRWQHSPAAYLLAATGQALKKRHNGGQPTVIDLERNGRSHPELDLSDAVGWFGLHHPVLAPYLPTAEVIEHLALEVADVPDQGTGYGALRWSGRPTSDQRSVTSPSTSRTPAQRRTHWNAGSRRSPRQPGAAHPVPPPR